MRDKDIKDQIDYNISKTFYLSSNEYNDIELTEEMKTHQQEYIRILSNFIRTGYISDFR